MSWQEICFEEFSQNPPIAALFDSYYDPDYPDESMSADDLDDLMRAGKSGPGAHRPAWWLIAHGRWFNDDYDRTIEKADFPSFDVVYIEAVDRKTKQKRKRRANPKPRAPYKYRPPAYRPPEFSDAEILRVIHESVPMQKTLEEFSNSHWVSDCVDCFLIHPRFGRQGYRVSTSEVRIHIRDREAVDKRNREAGKVVEIQPYIQARRDNERLAQKIRWLVLEDIIYGPDRIDERPSA